MVTSQEWFCFWLSGQGKDYFLKQISEQLVILDLFYKILIKVRRPYMSIAMDT